MQTALLDCTSIVDKVAILFSVPLPSSPFTSSSKIISNIFYNLFGNLEPQGQLMWEWAKVAEFYLNIKNHGKSKCFCFWLYSCQHKFILVHSNRWPEWQCEPSRKHFLRGLLTLVQNTSTELKLPTLWKRCTSPFKFETQDTLIFVIV